MTSLGDEPTDDFQEARKYPGGEFLELVLKEAYKRLGDQPIDNLYRACLLGGDTGARLMLAYDRRCLELWQKGRGG